MLMLVRARAVYAAAKGVVGAMKEIENLKEGIEVRYALPKDVTPNAVFDMNGSGVGICVDFIPTQDGFILEKYPYRPHHVVALCQGSGPVVGSEWGIGSDPRFDMLLSQMPEVLEKLSAMEKQIGRIPTYGCNVGG